MKSLFTKRRFFILAIVASLASCGGSSQNNEGGTDPIADIPIVEGQPDPDGAPMEEGSLVLEGVQENILNPTEVSLDFKISTTTFDVLPSEITIQINDRAVDVSPANISSNKITAKAHLQDGKNLIVFKAYDDGGRAVQLTKTVWAGANTLTVTTADLSPAANSLVAGAALEPDGLELRLSLREDPTVTAVAKVVSGSATFNNVPPGLVKVETLTPGGRFGVVEGDGSASSLTLPLLPFNSPVEPNNNDFSKKEAGYKVNSNAYFDMVGHVESGHPFDAPDNPLNRDGVLSAKGTDSVTATVSHTFKLKPGTSKVSVRYRFFLGSLYRYRSSDSRLDDKYTVTIRSKSGTSVSETQSMQKLSESDVTPIYFMTEAGITPWKKLTLKTDKLADEIQVDLVLVQNSNLEHWSSLIVDSIEEESDEVTPALSWDRDRGGLSLTYKVGSKALEKPVNIDVHWANGPTFSARLGTAITTFVVPAGTPAGQTGAVPIPGSKLQDNPSGTTHLIAVVDPSNVGAVNDVQIAFGPNAIASVVSPEMTDVVKDGYRAAGAKRGVISRTAATPPDQARAMFQNLTMAPGPLQVNIAYQRSKYYPPGKAVITVFESMTTGMTREQALANAPAIRAAMLEEIIRQGPPNVSKHCADPATISVVDVPYANFTSTGRPLFNSIAVARSRTVDEPMNKVFHLEIPR